MTALRIVRSQDVEPAEVSAIRALLDRAFDGAFDDDDWGHALGGLHFVVADEEVLAHASVVPRTLELGAHTLSAGYVEAVGTDPARQGEGHGTAVMQAASAHIAAVYDVGALSTGSPTFYERLGWERWAGPSYVDLPDGAGRERTPEDDDGILVLRTARTPEVPATAAITCPWRAGDVW